ncbi:MULTISPECIES: RAMP superfamily CRISPR-associated protein [unclassified Bradyrhizobium]|uniref:RAMP superfamily CRISPR-associated protein n=1 Tax=unclassified Bradyrhizobium TaxID=2631580 RepID=UPI0028E5B22C|nr:MULTISPECIES: RAMP superfamily CRISPR-associated protein [unclassified Bradyrhizobium]
MPAARSLTAEFEVLTPLFLGGADQSRAELRPPSFRGLLRFWYRAADPAFRSWEPRLFGGIGEGEGQGAVLLRITSRRPPQLVEWGSFRADRFKQGQGRDTRNGLVYLGFPFQMKDGGRRAIATGHRFELRCLLRHAQGASDNEHVQMQRRLAAAVWLLAHFGGAGSRSRRGFGSLALRNWSDAGGDWLELDRLPLVSEAASVQDARARLDRGLATIREWFGPWEQPDHAGQSPQHPHLGPSFRHALLDISQTDWAQALAGIGGFMQKFRLRRAPDYQSVKDHLLAKTGQGGSLLSAAPERATFGLPLTFRYSSIPRETAQLLPQGGEGQMPLERHGSLLLLRLAAIGKQLHPHYVRMDGAVPGVTPRAIVRGTRRALLEPSRNAMDAFFDSLPSVRR